MRLNTLFASSTHGVVDQQRRGETKKKESRLVLINRRATKRVASHVYVTRVACADVIRDVEERGYIGEGFFES